MELSPEEKLRLLSDLIALASADGEYRDEEFDLLHQVAEMLAVEPIEVEKLFTLHQHFHAPSEEFKRIIIFHHLLVMMNADGEVSHDEVFLLKELGIKLGLSVQAIDLSIEATRLYPNGNIPAEEMIRIFQVQHN